MRRGLGAAYRLSCPAARVGSVTTALYRRYRPETFADVIGQEHVTEPLMQALRTGRVNHAYLFSGPRGCGKTTSARILARCLNCEQGPTPTPCGACDSCVALARGGAGSVDVIEIDAASHGGVDDARDLRERASYAPAQSRYKVYIIDEAHMVTPQGFNALLKIVEEPPDHVKFVFATTEPDKVIGTIRSRTHHYPFRLVPPARLQAYLEQLCEAEAVAVEPGVLSFVVRAGGGSVRDALSVLDQLIAGSGDEGLTYDRAAALLGFTDAELLDATIAAFGAGDAAAVFEQIDRVIEAGLDPRRFVEDLLERFRDLIVVAAVPDGASSILRGLPEDQVDRMRHQAAAFGPGSLSRAADVVNAGLTDMTGATAPRLQLELIAARVLLPGAAGEQGYAARLDRLERRLDVEGVPTAGRVTAGRVTPGRVTAGPTSGGPGPEQSDGPDGADRAPDREGAGTPRDGTEPREPDARGEGGGDHPAEGPAAPPSATHEAVPTAGPAPKGPGGLDLAAIRRSWPDVLGRIFTLKRSTWTFLSEHAQVVDYDGQRLVLGIATVGLANTFRTGVHAEVVRQALIDALGIDVRVEGIPSEDAGSRRPSEAGPGTGSSGGTPQTRSSAGSSSGGPRGSDSGSPGGSDSAGGGGAGGGGIGGRAVGDAPATGAGRSGAEVSDWTSRPSAPDSAPAWATGPDPDPGPPSAAGAREDTTSAARDESPAGERPPSPPSGQGPREADDSAVSADDEDIVEATEFGRPVVERLLGGTVIAETED